MGEVFKLNHCYNMDCLPAMELFPDNYFDLAVVDAMWMNVYSNNPQISTKGVYDRAVALAVEAIQTAAMARKFERSQRRHWPGAKDPHYGEEE